MRIGTGECYVYKNTYFHEYIYAAYEKNRSALCY
jgi:hypothetical protein